MSSDEDCASDASDMQGFQFIAEGVASTVRLVRSQDIAEQYAVKTSSTYARFCPEPHDIVKEVRLLIAVKHPNIITVLDSSRHPDPETGSPSLSYWMPYLPYTLSDVLASPSFSPFPSPTASETDGESETSFTSLTRAIARQIFSALTYLHRTCVPPIAHRDVKPSNILFTPDGTLVLIDFGIAFRHEEDGSARDGDVWPEDEQNMYFQVSTGPYRAPELLFRPPVYNAPATDIWSAGALLAELFRPLRLLPSFDEEDGEDLDEENADVPPKPFIVPKSAPHAHATAKWERLPLFDASRGEIGLAWSIFRVRGTPDEESWPTFSTLPDASKVTFRTVPPVPLVPLLPHLTPLERSETALSSPSAEPISGVLDLIQRLLVYEPAERLRAQDTFNHPWLAEVPDDNDNSRARALLMACVSPAQSA